MSSLLQIVNFEEEFNKGLGKYLDGNGLVEKREKFHVVSIIGPQSSGKSTLLNLVFRTGFQTMDAESGRYQVTQGIWLGYDKTSSSLVLDLEGTDSRERGDLAGPFERKSALFALALSEVLMINIWTQDIGRLSASNLLLLKNILELDIELFLTAKKSNSESLTKTKLLFVLRDHVSSPLEKLTSILRADVAKIWEGIEKPDNMKTSKVEEFFDLEFYSLPHKNLAAEEFEAAAGDLRERVCAGTYFESAAYNRGVEADGFAIYAQNIWKTIQSKRELDLPSQREMVSVVRCDEAQEIALSDAQGPIADLEKATKPVDNLSGKALEILNTAVAKYKELTLRQVPAVVSRKEQEMHGRISHSIAKLLSSQIDVVSEVTLREFRIIMDQAVEKDDPWTGFGVVSTEAVRTATADFDSQCSAPEGVTTAENLVKTRRRNFIAELDEELDAEEKDVLRAAQDRILEDFSGACREKIVPIADAESSASMWTEAERELRELMNNVEVQSKEYFGSSGMNFEAAKVESNSATMKEKCLSVVSDELHKVIGDQEGILRRMKQRFNTLFRFDGEDNPRVWGPRDNVPAIFASALRGSHEVGDVLAKISLGDMLNEVIADENAVRELKQQLENDASLAFVDARHAQELARMKTKVPLWALGLIAVLGYDELKMVWKHPLKLFLFMFLFFILYFGYMANLHIVIMEPLQEMLKPYLLILRERLEEHLMNTGQKPSTIQSTPDGKSNTVPAESAGASSLTLDTASEISSIAKKEN